MGSSAHIFIRYWNFFGGYGHVGYGLVFLLIRLNKRLPHAAVPAGTLLEKYGNNYWPAVHRLDAPHLYRLILGKGTAGSRYHGVADGGIPVRYIAKVISKYLNLPVVFISAEAAAEHFEWMSRFIVLDSPASSTKIREQLGWDSIRPGLMEDLNMNHYFEN